MNFIARFVGGMLGKLNLLEGNKLPPVLGVAIPLDGVFCRELTQCEIEDAMFEYVKKRYPKSDWDELRGRFFWNTRDSKVSLQIRVFKNS